MLSTTISRRFAHRLRCPITSLLRWDAHLPANVQTNFRKFSVSFPPRHESLEDGVEVKIESRSEPRWKGYSDRVRPMATWLLPPGADVDAETIIQQLPTCSDHALRYLNSVTFLVTPKLAHLIESDSNFLAAAMNQIWPPIFFSQLRGRRIHSITTYVAVVDAIPGIPHHTLNDRPEIYGYEGLAVMLSPRVICDADESQNEDTMPLISFTGKRPISTSKTILSATYSAPVANTLFVNGRKHTMFRERWKPSDEGKLCVETNRHYLSRIEIPVYESFGSRRRLPTTFNAQLMRLTAPARITASMGNIIRNIETKSGEVISASHELEQILPPLVKKFQAEKPNTEVRVFALVWLSRSSERRHSFKERGFGFRSAQNGTQEKESFLLRDNLQNALLRDARLYRVTSGGAGWGNKAGLLSLEPNTQLNAKPEETPSFFPGFEFEAIDSLPGATELFRPGYSVQFLASWHDVEGRDKDGYSLGDISDDQKWLRDHYFSPSKLQKLCIGTAVQNENWSRSQSFEHRGGDANRDANQKMGFYPNRFGLLTTSAMSLSSKRITARAGDTKKELAPSWNDAVDLMAPNDEVANLPDRLETHSTLIEVPNSSFMAIFAAGGRERTPGGSKHTGIPEDEEVGTQSAQSKGRPQDRPKNVVRRVRAVNISFRWMDFRDSRMGSIPRHVRTDEKDMQEHLRELHLRHIANRRAPNIKKVQSESSLFDQRKAKGKDVEEHVDDLLEGI